MTISIIVAASENNAIGKDNRLLWHLPEDLRFFKNKTWGFPVIMGRKTFEAVGKPLPGRMNIVISSQPDLQLPGALVVPTIQAALKEAESADAREVFITGGGQIYREAMPICERIYLTRVHAELDGDTFFPPLDPESWEEGFSLRMEADEKHAYAMTFSIFDRKIFATN